MAKILVSLHIPSIEQHFDIFIPSDVTVQRLTEMFCEGVTSISNGRFHTSDFATLCRKSPDMLLDPNCLVSDYHISDGEELVLI